MRPVSSNLVPFQAHRKADRPAIRFAGDTPFQGLSQDVLDILEEQPDTNRRDFGVAVDKAAWRSDMAEWEQESYVNNYEPPKIPPPKENTRVVEVPWGYRSPTVSGQGKPPTPFDSQDFDLYDIRPGRPLVFKMDRVRPDTAAKVDRDPKAWINPDQDPLAKELVESGLQPSIISKRWKACWGVERLSRDVFQNFFDGHGGTLEGIKLSISRESSYGPYTVRIEGDGEYSYEKAYLLGGTSKDGEEPEEAEAEDERAATAGQFGEGLKVMTLNLLRDFGSTRVEMSSANWKMTYGMPETTAARPNPKMMRKLEVLDHPQHGNYLEFDTTSPELIENLTRAVNYFSHPYNPDFQNTTCTNAVGGIKISPGQKGNVYIAGQRFSVQPHNEPEVWDEPLEGFSIWHHKNTLDKGRDRSALGIYDVSRLAQAILKEASDEDLVHMLNAMRSYWPEKTRKNDLGRDMADSLVRMIVDVMARRKLSISFPGRMYAGHERDVDPSTMSQIRTLGCSIYPGFFRAIGMPPVADYHKYAQSIQSIPPNEFQKQRINLLKATMARVIQAIDVPKHGEDEQPRLSREDIEKPVYLFKPVGNSAPMEAAAGIHWLGGVWLAQSTINGGSFRNGFYEAFNTYLHELLHRHGSDDSAEFSYAYHDMLPILLTEKGKNSEVDKILHEAEVMWNDSTREEQAANAPKPQTSYSQNRYGDTFDGTYPRRPNPGLNDYRYGRPEKNPDKGYPGHPYKKYPGQGYSGDPYKKYPKKEGDPYRKDPFRKDPNDKYPYDKYPYDKGYQDKDEFGRDEW